MFITSSNHIIWFHLDKKQDGDFCTTIWSQSLCSNLQCFTYFYLMDNLRCILQCFDFLKLLKFSATYHCSLDNQYTCKWVPTTLIAKQKSSLGLDHTNTCLPIDLMIINVLFACRIIIFVVTWMMNARITPKQ